MNAPARKTEPAPIGFDYSTLSKATASEARAVAKRVREREKRAIADIVESGRELLQVKEKIGHGRFGEWLEAEFGQTIRTAQNYMLVAAEFGDKYETISYLPLATVYALAAPATPAPVREQVVQQSEGR